MTNVKFKQVSTLPSTSEKGAIYFTVDGELYLGDSNGGFVGYAKDVEFTSDLTLITNPQLNKMYLLSNNDGIFMKVWDGTDFKDVSNLINSVHASGVIESSDRVFVSAIERSQINAYSSDINSHAQRIAQLETDILNSTSTDEKVKMDANGTSEYLNDLLDNNTIQNENGKLTVKTLNGLIATLQEINHLQGVSGNIQSQIDSLNNIGNYTTSVSTYNDLLLITDMEAKDMVIVTQDETKPNSPSTIYIYNGTDWIYSGDFKGGEVRDFTTNPINLTTETTGLLQKSKYEKQNALETPFNDSTGELRSTNTQDAIKEAFTYAVNGKSSLATTFGYPLNASDTFPQMTSKISNLKQLFANVITAKGVPAYTYNTFEDFANKISVIPNVTIDGGIQRVSKLNITAPYELRIPLQEALQLSDITATLIEFIEGDKGIVHYQVDFNNGDESDFETNDRIEFDGTMKLKTLYTLDMLKNDDWTEGSLHEIEILQSDWLSVDKLEVIVE